MGLGTGSDDAAMTSKLLGTWSGRHDDEPEAEVIQEFHPDGTLTYIVRKQSGAEVADLIYSVRGNVLVTDQPDDPQIRETRFRFEGDDVLVLEYAGEEFRYQRDPSRDYQPAQRVGQASLLRRIAGWFGRRL